MSTRPLRSTATSIKRWQLPFVALTTMACITPLKNRPCRLPKIPRKERNPLHTAMERTHEIGHTQKITVKLLTRPRVRAVKGKHTTQVDITRKKIQRQQNPLQLSPIGRRWKSLNTVKLRRKKSRMTKARPSLIGPMNYQLFPLKIARDTINATSLTSLKLSTNQDGTSK